MRIYLAASFADQKKMRRIGFALNGMGHSVTSRWLDIDLDVMNQSEIESDPLRARESALMDFGDVRASELIAVFTETPSTTGGFHVELGIGIGLRKAIVIIGPMTNIFHAMPDAQHFAEVTEFLAFAEGLVRSATSC